MNWGIWYGSGRLMIVKKRCGPHSLTFFFLYCTDYGLQSEVRGWLFSALTDRQAVDCGAYHVPSIFYFHSKVSTVNWAEGRIEVKKKKKEMKTDWRAGGRATDWHNWKEENLNEIWAALRCKKKTRIKLLPSYEKREKETRTKGRKEGRKEKGKNRAKGGG